MTDTTLTQVFRRRVDAVPGTGTVRLVVRWDHETGWAHVGIADADTSQVRFAGFHRFAGGDPDAVAGELAAAGCVTGSALRLDDGLTEIEAVLVRREVTADAAR